MDHATRQPAAPETEGTYYMVGPFRAATLKRWAVGGLLLVIAGLVIAAGIWWTLDTGIGLLDKAVYLLEKS